MRSFSVRTHRQLVQDGVAPSTIAARCRRGSYHRVLPRTYVLGELSKLARCFAVVEWRPDALLSHRTAGWLYGWLPEPDIVEASVPPGVRASTPKWLRLYRRREPLVGDTQHGLPAVSREQALVDCVAVLPVAEAERLVDEQLAAGIDLESLLLVCKRHPKRRGNAAVDRIVRSAVTCFASEPERLLARAFVARGFDMAANRRVGPYVCDFVDEQSRVIVEVDGREFHSDPETFRKDRRRQNWLVLRGWLVLRYAAYDVLADAAAVAAEVIDIVRRRRHARR